MPKPPKVPPKALPQRGPVGRAGVPPKAQVGNSGEDKAEMSNQQESAASDGVQPSKESAMVAPASVEIPQKSEPAIQVVTSDSASPSHDQSHAGVETAAHSPADGAPPVVAKTVPSKNLRPLTPTAPRPGGKAVLPSAKAGVASPSAPSRSDPPSAGATVGTDASGGELPVDGARPPAEAVQQTDAEPAREKAPLAVVPPLAPVSPVETAPALEKPLVTEVGVAASPTQEEGPAQLKEAVPTAKAAPKAKLPVKQPLRPVVKPESKFMVPPVMPDVQESAKPAGYELAQPAAEAAKEEVMPAAKTQESDAPIKLESEPLPAAASASPPEVRISPLPKTKVQAKAAGRMPAKPVEKPLAPSNGMGQELPPIGMEGPQKTPSVEPTPLEQEQSATPALSEKASTVVEPVSTLQPAEPALPAQATKVPGKVVGAKGASRSALKQAVLVNPAAQELPPVTPEVVPSVTPPVAPVEDIGAVATPEVPVAVPAPDSPPVQSETLRPAGNPPAKIVGPRGQGRAVLKQPVPMPELPVPTSEAISPVVAEVSPTVESDAAASQPDVSAVVPESDSPPPAIVQPQPMAPVLKAPPKTMGPRGQAKPMPKALAPSVAKPVVPDPGALPPVSTESPTIESPVEEKPSPPHSSGEVATAAPGSPSEQPLSAESAPAEAPVPVVKPATKGMKASAKPQAKTVAKPLPVVEPDKVAESTEPPAAESPVEEKPSPPPSSGEVATTTPGLQSEQPLSGETAPAEAPVPVVKPAIKGVKASAKPQAKAVAKPPPAVEPDKKATEAATEPMASPISPETATAKPEVPEQIIETAPLESAPAGEKPVVPPREWSLLGELYFPASATNGKISLSLEDVRRRGSYYEVWERVEFLPRKGVLGWLGDADAAKERLTLWAVRCGRGMMARILEATDGAFGPRAESLKFYVPIPASAGAAVVETVCYTMRQRAEANGTDEVLESRRFKKKMKQTGLDAPPMILDATDFDEEDEPPRRR
ncbi:hypothetical protein [Azonexus sp. IMCC34839]|uniref:hypothetical protein n=1 Tax=Azonexus sp. IMCC34839 TaxID=3133695 RepID=UPI003999C04A